MHEILEEKRPRTKEHNIYPELLDVILDEDEARQAFWLQADEVASGTSHFIIQKYKYHHFVLPAGTVISTCGCTCITREHLNAILLSSDYYHSRIQIGRLESVKDFILVPNEIVRKGFEELPYENRIKELMEAIFSDFNH